MSDKEIKDRLDAIDERQKQIEADRQERKLEALVLTIFDPNATAIGKYRAPKVLASVKIKETK